MLMLSGSIYAPMKLIVILVFSVAVFAQQGPGPGGDRGGMSFIRMSPILNAVDVNQDGVLSAAEIASAPARLRTLDKNGDGILTQDEAGIQMGFGRGGGRGRGEGGGRGEEGGGDEPPAPAPTAEELTATLMMFDANHNGQLEKSEVPERMQGLFERGDTNHAESIRITFDPSKISYGQLLKIYFSVAHDPTTLNRQHHDVGTQYRSSIFYIGDDQKAVAEAYIKELNDKRVFPDPVVTKVVPMQGFFRAEEYHQHYLDQNPTQPYIVAMDLPLIENLKHEYPDWYKK